MVITFFDPIGLAPALKHLVEEPDIQVQIIRVSDVLKRNLEQFVARIAHNFGDAPIDVQPLSLRAHMRDPHAGMLERGPEHGITFNQHDCRFIRFLGLTGRHALSSSLMESY